MTDAGERAPAMFSGRGKSLAIVNWWAPLTLGALLGLHIAALAYGERLRITAWYLLRCGSARRRDLPGWRPRPGRLEAALQQDHQYDVRALPRRDPPRHVVHAPVAGRVPRRN